MTDILPCKKCDENNLEINMENYALRITRYFIECSNCDNIVKAGSKKKVIQRWNERNKKY
jgi:hypothetical protein